VIIRPIKIKLQSNSYWYFWLTIKILWI